ncbi:MAG: cytochrome c3 family protein, partial [Sphingomonadales bacterium]|nr:cytochrome c3 family protein [Sphingomonadales bacterium]
DLLLPGIATCRECHAGENGGGERVASSCALCHSYHQGDGAPYLVRARNRRGARPQTTRDYGGLTINPADR